jgi:hypothetical protein
VTRRGPDWLPVLSFPLVAALLFPRALTGAGAFFHYDTWLQNLPFRAWWFEQLRHGHFATWCPGVFAGYPLFAETQTGPLYPPTFALFLALPPTIAFAWSVWLHFVWAGLGAFVLARRLGLGTTAALFAGVAYELSGFHVTHVVHFNLLTGAAWVPWTIACALAAARGSPRGTVAFALCVACLLLGAHPYATIMALAASAGVVLLWTPTTVRSMSVAGFAVAFGVALGVGIAAVQVFPTRELLPQTTRGGAVAYEFLTFGSFPPWNLATLVAPDLFGTPVDGSFFGGPDWSHFAETCSYVGIVTLVLAIVAIVLRGDRVVLTSLAGASVALLLMLGKYTPVYRMLGALPLLQSTRLPARFSLLFTLFVALLAAAGLEALMRSTDLRRRRIALGVGVGSVLALGIVAWAIGADARSPSAAFTEAGGAWPLLVESIRANASESWRRVGLVLVLAVLAVAPWLRSRLDARWAWAPLVVVAFDLLSWGRLFNPLLPADAILTPPPAVEALPATEPRPRVVRQGVDEIWSRGPRVPHVDAYTDDWRGHESSYATGAWSLPPNTQLLYGVDSVEGFTSLLPLQWLTWVGLDAAPGATPRPDLTEAQADLLSIDAVISSGSGIAGEGWSAQPLPGDLWLSTNLDPLPRVRIARSWAEFEWGSRDVVELVRSPDYEPRGRVLLERPDTSGPLGPSANENGGADFAIDALEVGPGHWEIEVPEGERSVVVVAESYDPGWVATSASGSPLDVYRADGLFVAFEGPTDGGRVTLRYTPRSLRTGTIVSALALLIAFAWWRLPSRDEPTASVGTRVPLGTIPMVVAIVLIGSAIADIGDWRRDHRDSTLTGAAVRQWNRDALSAFQGRAFDPAARLLYRAIEFRPDDAALWFRVGLVEKERGRPNEARRAFDRCLAIDPTATEAQRELDELSVSSPGS